MVAAGGLHVETHGAGPALVLAHGFGGSARNWRPQLRALKGDFAVSVYDARGHARSAKIARAEDARAEAVAADFAAVADAASAEPLVAGGRSMGAATAIERDGLEAAGARFAWGPGAGLDPQAASWVRAGFLEHDAQSLAHLLREYLARLEPPEALAPALAALRTPTLVLVGGDDAASLPAARALAQALPNARLEQVPGAGHVVNLAAPERVNAVLREFLTEGLAQPDSASEPAPAGAVGSLRLAAWIARQRSGDASCPQ
jgi:pimeloyl-ACP methyl ester carboxylesterase